MSYSVNHTLGENMSLIRYQNAAAKVLGIPVLGNAEHKAKNLHQIGSLKLGSSANVRETLINMRLEFVSGEFEKAKAEGIIDQNDIDNGEFGHSLFLTYDAYLFTIKNAQRIIREGMDLEGEKRILQEFKAHQQASLPPEYKETHIQNAISAYGKNVGGIIDQSIDTYNRRVAADNKRAEAIQKMELQIATKETTLETKRVKFNLAFSAPMRRLAIRYDLDVHTPNEEGYLRYLKELAPAFHRLLEEKMPAMLLESDRERHTYVTGGSGSGKTELLKQIIYSYVQKPDCGAVIVLDPHGDMVRQIAKWKEFADDPDRLVYIDPFLFKEELADLVPEGQIMRPTMNPMEMKTGSVQEKDLVVQQLISLIGALLSGGAGGVLTDPQKALIRSCIYVLLELPNPTVADLQNFMNKNRNQKYIAQAGLHHDDVVREFF